MQESAPRGLISVALLSSRRRTGCFCSLPQPFASWQPLSCFRGSGVLPLVRAELSPPARLCVA